MVLSLQAAQNAGYLLGNTTGFLAKQYFCYYGLEGVRRELDTVISSIAERFFGNMVGRAVGHQLSYVASIPYTVFLGDLIWTTTSEIIQSTVLLTAKSIGIVERNIRKIPVWMDLALRISSATISYFAKCAFIHAAMPTVKIAVEKLILYAAIYGTTNVFFRASLVTIAPISAITIAPMATFFIADALGMLLQTSLYTGSNTVATLAYNHIFPLPDVQTERYA